MLKNKLPLIDAKLCGSRLKSLRKMTGFSRKAFAGRHEISANTLQNWEDGKSGGLTDKGAKRILLALREEGIQCSKNWLLHGVGNSPYVSDKLYQRTNHKPANRKSVANESEEETLIINELMTFRQYYQDTIDMVVKDDAMTPYFMAGDYVAGKRFYKESIQALCGMNCIVETNTGEIYLRRLKAGNKADHYTLVCVNLDTSCVEPLLFNLELVSAAPVLWHRRKAPTQT